VARVLAVIPDLLFGSKVQAALGAAGHEVVLVADPAAARAQLRERAAQVVVVDLASDPQATLELGGLDGARTLGFYSHVDTETRARAEAAGFDLVVPRSRMNREGAALVTRLAAG
jgi:DNA-binding NarL/FixJ family response regulator